MSGFQSHTGRFQPPPFLPQFPPLLGERVAQMTPELIPALVSVHDSRVSATSVLTVPLPLKLTACAFPAAPPPTPDASVRAERPGELGMSEILRKWQILCVNH